LQSQEVFRALKKQIEGKEPTADKADSVSGSSNGKAAEKAVEEKKDDAGASMQINTETKDEQSNEAIVLIRSFLRMLNGPSSS